MDQITIISVITAVSALGGAAFGYLGFLGNARKDFFSAGSAKGSQEADTAYIKRRVDDILLEQKDTNKSINVLAERVTRVEESTKAAHQRIEQIEEKLQGQ